MENNSENPSSELFTVCGGRIKDVHLHRFPSAQYQGKTVYFCTQACLDVFEKDPDPFMAGDIEHPAD